MATKIVICESYPQVKYTLPLLEERDVTMLVFSKRMADVYGYIQDEHPELRLRILLMDKCFEESFHWWSLYSWRSILFPIDVIRARLRINKIYARLSNIKNQSVYFFSKWTSADLGIILGKLHRQNTIVYTQDFIIDRLQIKPVLVNWTQKRRLVAYRLMGRGNMQYGSDFAGRNVLGLSDGYAKHLISCYKKPHTNTSLAFSSANHLYHYIFLEENLIEPNYVDEATYRNEMESIWRLLLKYIPRKELVIKRHPDNTKGKMIQVDELTPAWLPVEFFYNENTQVVISIASLGLTTSKALAISILELVTFRNTTLKEMVKHIFKGTNVLLPKTLGELEDILIKERDEVLNGLPK